MKVLTAKKGNRAQQYRGALEQAAKALRPFSDAVFNDNGDMSVNMAFAKYEDFCSAYFAFKRINDLLAKPLPLTAPND